MVSTLIYQQLDRQKWDELLKQYGGEFLQGWDWGEFQESLGKRVIRFFEGDLGLAQVIITQLPFGLSWAYVPRGPVFFNPDKVQDLVGRIVQALPVGCIFLVLEPADQVSLPLDRFKPRQPIETIVLNLDQNDEQLLDGMHSKTRYSIKRSLTSELEFGGVEDVSEFYGLLISTARRQGFRTYSEDYFKKMVEAIGRSGIGIRLRDWPGFLTPSVKDAPTLGVEANLADVKILGARHNGKLLSAGLYMLFGSTAFYLHSGSDHEARSLMAPYFMHWEAIKYFKGLGLKNYDFWGIDRQRWPGITRFKTRFGGKTKIYPGAYVKALKPFWFRIYKLAKRLS